MDERQKILDELRQRGVPFEYYEHQPLENVLDRVEKDLCFGAEICKNLFVTTRKRDRIFLVMLQARKRADLRQLARAMGTTHLGFAPPELLESLLGQKPGAVGPLGVLHDKKAVVEAVLDQDLRALPRVAMHPSVNTATVVLAFDDLERVIRQNGNTIYFLPFDAGA